MKEYQTPKNRDQSGGYQRVGGGTGCGGEKVKGTVVNNIVISLHGYR